MPLNGTRPPKSLMETENVNVNWKSLLNIKARC